MIKRFFTPSEQSFFLFGPRGTGKSTWCRVSFPDALYIDLLDPHTCRIYLSNPNRLRELIDGNPEKKSVIIDEVQRVPAVLPLVHKIIEEKRGIQFVITGSSSRKLKREGIDLLAGRAIMKVMHPFMAAELETAFSLESALEYGMVPLVVDSDNLNNVLKTYISLYIREEVQFEGLVRNVGDFARFLEAVSFSHGSVLNISNIARDCMVGRKTVESYINILTDLLIAWKIPVFTKRAKRNTVPHPKFYLFDSGVYKSLRPSGPLDRPEEIGGMALEGLVAQHLKAWIDYSHQDLALYYWRTKSGTEVDFIIYGAECFTAIEVKNSNRIRAGDLRGLKTFLKNYPEASALLLYRGNEKLKIDTILCVPCEEFLLQLLPGRVFPDKL